MHGKKSVVASEGKQEEDVCCCGDADCGDGGCTDQCGDDACGGCCKPESSMSKEQLGLVFTKIASDAWMKAFFEACDKEVKKSFGKNIQRLAAKHVKLAGAEMKKKMGD